MSPASRAIAAAAAAALAFALACRDVPPPPPVQRLLPALGAAEHVELDGVTRPATTLRPGEARSCEVVTREGSRLRFWVGLRDFRESDALDVVVRADGREVYSRRIPGHRERGWRQAEASLPTGRSMKLELVTKLVPGAGRPAGAAEPSVLIGSPRLVSPAPPKPRVLVWISQDAVRADHLSLYGYARPTSPRVGERSKAWVVFEDATASAPWTLPSLASQFTGRHPSYHGAADKRYRRDPAWPTVFQVLADAGFTVLGVTGNSFFAYDFGLADGFDALFFSDGRADALNRLALGALGEWDGGDLALIVHYMDPHFTYLPPSPWDSAFDPGYRGRVTGANFQDVLGTKAAARDLAHVVALYDGEIAWTDSEIDRLLGRLAGHGLLDRAVLLYTADHGDAFLEHGLWQHGHTLYQELVRVPFAIAAPGLSPRRVSEPVTLLDVAPTALDALGVRVPPSMQGESLLPLARGRGRAPRLVYTETQNRPDADRRFAVREGTSKYVLTLSRDRQPRVVREELYDLGRDPREARDLGAAAVPERLRQALRKYLEGAPAGGEISGGKRALLRPEVEERLRALGYVN